VKSAARFPFVSHLSLWPNKSPALCILDAI
jgi:hypothetical protein